MNISVLFCNMYNIPYAYETADDSVVLAEGETCYAELMVSRFEKVVRVYIRDLFGGCLQTYSCSAETFNVLNLADIVVLVKKYIQ